VLQLSLDYPRFFLQIPNLRLPETEYVDSSAQLWAIVFNEGEKYDRTLVESWKGDMDGILIFVRFIVHSASHNMIERLFSDWPFLCNRRGIHHRWIQISFKGRQ